MNRKNWQKNWQKKKNNNNMLTVGDSRDRRLKVGRALVRVGDTRAVCGERAVVATGERCLSPLVCSLCFVGDGDRPLPLPPPGDTPRHGGLTTSVMIQPAVGDREPTTSGCGRIVARASR